MNLKLMSRPNASLSSTFRPGVQRETGDSSSSQDLEENKVMANQTKSVPENGNRSFAGSGISRPNPPVGGGGACGGGHGNPRRGGHGNPRRGGNAGRGNPDSSTDVCGVCLRLCAIAKHEQAESIDSAKRYIADHGIEAARAKYSVDMCVKCEASAIIDGVCVQCEGTESIHFCATDHQQLDKGTLLIRNDVTLAPLGELFFAGEAADSWHLVVQPARPSRGVRAKFDALFSLIHDGRRNDHCVLVNSDQVISQMVPHVSATEYQRVTPNFCPSHIAAKAAWRLLRVRSVPLNVAIWHDALKFHLDRERIRRQAEEDVAAGRVAFGDISRRIYEGVSISGYLVGLVNQLISSCAASQCSRNNRIKLQSSCDGIIGELIRQIVEESEVEGLVAESSFDDICEAVVSNSLLACSMFHVIRRIWLRKIALVIHPDHGGLAADFARCNNIFEQLEKFLLGNSDVELDNYRRSVVVVRKATQQVHKQLEDIRSAPRGYLQAAKTGISNPEVSSPFSKELVVFEDFCGALVLHGVDQSLVTSLACLHETVPEEAEDLANNCVAAASSLIAGDVATTLAMVAIATGATTDLTPSGQRGVVSTFAMEQVPKIFTEVEYPGLGTTRADVDQAISNLTSEELSVYESHLAVRLAEEAAEVIEQMDEEDEAVDDVSDDVEEAEVFVNDANFKEADKAIVRGKIASTINQMRYIVYFNSSVSDNDRAHMLEYLLGVRALPSEYFISEMQSRYSNTSAGSVYKMRDFVAKLIGEEKRMLELQAINLQRVIAGLEAKKMRDAEEAKKAAEPKEKAVQQFVRSSNVCAQPDVYRENESHKAAQALRAKAFELSMCQYGIAWVRSLTRDRDSGKYVITDIFSGLTLPIPDDLAVTVYSSAKVKDCGKVTKENKRHDVNMRALCKRIEDRAIPDGYYLRPLVIRYKPDGSIAEIDAGTTGSTERNIRYIRGKMSDEKYEDDIDEIDASLEGGKGEFVSTFCARRASSSERAARSKEALEKKRTSTIEVQVLVEFQYENEEGELVDDYRMETVSEVVANVHTGRNNYYKSINPNHGTESGGRVRI